MHPMRRHENKRQGEPEPSHPNRNSDRNLGEEKQEHESLERDAADAVLFAQRRDRFFGCRDISHSYLARAAGCRSGIRQMFSRAVVSKRPSSSSSGWENRLSRKSQATP